VGFVSFFLLPPSSFWSGGGWLPAIHEGEDVTDNMQEIESELNTLETDLEEDPEEVEEDSAPLEFMDSQERVRLMVEAADAVRAGDIAVLDLRGLTIIADFFLICTGKSSIQLRAIADRIEERLREAGERKLRVEGYQEATWILLDYGDVVAHIMAAEQRREFYNLEGFWSSAPHIELSLMPEATSLS
jgi:ribosome-associated protein